jgi:hypothetical protein
MIPRTAALILLAAVMVASAAIGGEPPLPPGMGGGEKEKKRDAPPPLPPGMGGEEKGGGDAPPLPPGMGGDEKKPDAPPLPPGMGEDAPRAPARKKREWKLPFDLGGFIEARGGGRTQKDDQKDATVGEVRLQLEIEKAWERITGRLTFDLYYDGVAEDHDDVDLEDGSGFLDLREANLAGSPLDFADVKVGRQVLTWGTGDLLFINDLFPKDWRSFFVGRDDEYLKAPSDAVKLSLFSKVINLDAVYVPRFDPDRFITGERISYYSPVAGKRVGRDHIVDAEVPDDVFEDDEVALRLFGNAAGYELAAYYYHGYWKSPGGFDPLEGRATFPDLDVWGCSVRGKLGKGIANLEFGYYESGDDPDGDDPLVGNGQLRFLVGYSQELARDFSAGVQWYVEHTLDHDEYRDSLPPEAPVADESRHVLTLRLTRMLMKQNLRLSLFVYWSPTDRDAYLRPRAHYKIDDHWSAEVGGNVFLGEDEHTFFGQFEKNNNVYAGARYSF